MNEGHAAAAPPAVDRGKAVRPLGNEGLLLLWSEFEYAGSFVLIGERGEDAVVEAEVGMAHVGALGGSFEAESQLAEERDLSVHVGFGAGHSRIHSSSPAGMGNR